GVRSRPDAADRYPTPDPPPRAPPGAPPRRATVTGRVDQLRMAVELRRRRAAAGRLDAAPPAARATAQARAVGALRQLAVERSPLLRRRLAGLEHAPLAELPVLTKDDLV